MIRLGPGRPGMVRLEVSDDGPGIAPELMERIFEPSFTTPRRVNRLSVTRLRARARPASRP